MFDSLSMHDQYFYLNLSKMISKIASKRSSIKNEVFKSKSPRRYHRVLEGIIRNYDMLNKIAEKTNISDNLNLGIALIYDTLRGVIKNKEYERKFRDILGEIELKEPTFSKYIRLNKLKGITIDDLNEYNLEETVVPDVYKIVERSDSIKLYSDKRIAGKIKIQDICSCLPAYILNPPENSIVIDATAAPGNKTTHLSTIMKNTGKIYAIEKSKQRYNTMKKLIKEYGATNVEAINADFLKFTEANPDYILLDPSCSGSGIHQIYSKNPTRVDILHNLQSVMIKHALSFSPKKLVYSTCSIHEEEGEDVIKEALSAYDNYEVEDISHFYPSSENKNYEFSHKVIRTKKTDNQIGFFVALLKIKDL